MIPAMCMWNQIRIKVAIFKLVDASLPDDQLTTAMNTYKLLPGGRRPRNICEKPASLVFPVKTQ